MDEKEKTVKEVKDIKIGMSTDKKIIIAIVVSVLVIALGIFTWFYYNNNLRPVVTFDGGNLTAAEYSIYYKTFAPQYEYYQYPAAEIPNLIANEAAANKILLIKAKEAGFTLTAEDKAKIDDMFKDEERVQSIIDAGIDPVQMKEIYYNDAIITSYINKLKSDFTAEEVTAYLKKTYGETVNMNEYVTRHILFKTVDDYGSALDADKKAAAKTKAEAALARALAGEDFAALAKELSEDDGTKQNGGLYNVYLDDRTDAAYSKAAEALTVGSVTTALVESSYGYHIIKLDAKNDAGRVNSDYERQSMAYSKIDEIRDSVNVQIKKEALIKVVEGITGKKVEETTQDTTNQTTNETTGTEAAQ